MIVDPTAIPSLALQVVLKEYEMLRLEINMFNQYRQQLLTASAALLAGILTALAAALNSATASIWLGSFKDAYGVVFLVASVVFSLGGLLFAELRWRIFQVGCYLHWETRKRVYELLRDDRLLDWETFLGDKGPLRGWRFWLVENVGWLLFLLPATVFAEEALRHLWQPRCSWYSLALVLMLGLLVWVWIASVSLWKFKVKDWQPQPVVVRK